MGARLELKGSKVAALSDAIPILLLVVGMWLVSLWKRDAGLMDIAWGPGFVLVALWRSVAMKGDLGLRGVLLFVLLLLWAGRLAWHIARRHGGVEDARYAAWRAQAGASWWWRSLFKVFLLQGAVMWAVARPVTALLSFPTVGFSVWESGALLALAGLLWESVADAQLAAHRRRQPGVLCTTGLWSLHRHPNYFGEAIFWWGLGLWAAAVGAPLALLSSLLMHLLLRHVSGVPMLERSMSRKPGWEAYAARTPVFWPRLR